MRPAILLLSTQLAAGCDVLAAGPPPTNGEAMCREMEPLAQSHAAALAEGGNDASVATGQILIAGLAAGCSWEVPQ